jgi:hypothetical protein
VLRQSMVRQEWSYPVKSRVLKNGLPQQAR